jgi:hypothetical protein
VVWRTKARDELTKSFCVCVWSEGLIKRNKKKGRRYNKKNMSTKSTAGALPGLLGAIIPLGNQGVGVEGDVEEMRRWEYERWELDQAMSGLPEEEWEPFMPSGVEACKRARNDDSRKIVKNLKRPKEETGRERWERTEGEKSEKEIKRALRMGEKMRKEEKMNTTTSYFKK